mmetsp:Transcript_12394/g.31217  ORF Transcript_12394/g.31217 Transcript_12394/m.31217 type:complete len:283 (+) Transcript_12394:1944-2792(+)
MLDDDVIHFADVGTSNLEHVPTVALKIVLVIVELRLADRALVAMQLDGDVGVRPSAAYVRCVHRDSILHEPIQRALVADPIAVPVRVQEVTEPMLLVDPVVEWKHELLARFRVRHRDVGQVPGGTQPTIVRVDAQRLHWAQVWAGQEEGAGGAALKVVGGAVQLPGASVAPLPVNDAADVAVGARPAAVRGSHLNLERRALCGDVAREQLPAAACQPILALLQPLIARENVGLAIEVNLHHLQMPSGTEPRVVMSDEYVLYLADVRCLEPKLVLLAALEVVG